MRVDLSLRCDDDFDNIAKVVMIIDRTFKLSVITIFETFFGGNDLNRGLRSEKHFQPC